MHRVTAADKHVFAQELALVARRWRTRCDERLKHLGVDQASWSTLYWLKHSEAGISQAQLAERANVGAADHGARARPAGGPGPGRAAALVDRPARQPPAADRGGRDPWCARSKRSPSSCAAR